MPEKQIKLKQLTYKVTNPLTLGSHFTFIRPIFIVTGFY